MNKHVMLLAKSTVLGILSAISTTVAAETISLSITMDKSWEILDANIQNQQTSGNQINYQLKLDEQVMFEANKKNTNSVFAISIISKEDAEGATSAKDYLIKNKLPSPDTPHKTDNQSIGGVQFDNISTAINYDPAVKTLEQNYAALKNTYILEIYTACEEGHSSCQELNSLIKTIKFND
ncbi:hypothetical protein [Spartinivicinus ruber]|uniref:hypothetical protein n=1 Tax=Spartinivicinus ruber TaxID=2683272 RepID=UPI0013CF7543|nr:hypothetical protein [Spartinivicinus ruber]